MYRTISFGLNNRSASTSGISKPVKLRREEEWRWGRCFDEEADGSPLPNSSSIAMMTSTWSNESRPKSLMKCDSSVSCRFDEWKRKFGFLFCFSFNGASFRFDLLEPHQWFAAWPIQSSNIKSQSVSKFLDCCRFLWPCRWIPLRLRTQCRRWHSSLFRFKTLESVIPFVGQFCRINWELKAHAP